jgi:hypothetical protein
VTSASLVRRNHYLLPGGKIGLGRELPFADLGVKSILAVEMPGRGVTVYGWLLSQRKRLSDSANHLAANGLEETFAGHGNQVSGFSAALRPGTGAPGQLRTKQT